MEPTLEQRVETVEAQLAALLAYMADVAGQAGVPGPELARPRLSVVR